MVTLEEIKKFKPAEAYFLMYRNTLNGEMMKITLGDLIIRGCLKIERVRQKPNPKDPATVIYRMISKSNNFDNQEYNKAENLFTHFFEGSKTIYQLRPFARMVAKDISNNNQNYTKDYILDTQNLTPYINNSFSRFWDTRNSKGKKLGKEIEAYFNEKDKELHTLLKKNESEDIANIITALGGYIFLLPSFETKLIKEIRSLLKDTAVFDSGYFSGSDVFMIDSFDSFGSSLEDLNDTGGDFGGGGADGGWGDSGCSSCSGCGGCGGCGN